MAETPQEKRRRLQQQVMDQPQARYDKDGKRIAEPPPKGGSR